MADAMKCTVCHQTVEYPEWKCPKQPGKHTVPDKTYYHPGAGHIQNIRERRMFGPLVILVPTTEKINDQGQVVQVPGCQAQFADGQFHTEDPEQQYYLDRKPGILSGPEGLKVWRGIYLSPEQQHGLIKAEMEEMERKIKEGNSLLEQVKAQTKPTTKPAILKGE